MHIKHQSKLFPLTHYLGVHSTATSIFGAQVCLSMGFMAAGAKVLMSHECPQTLHYALILVLFLAIIKLPGLLTLSFKLIELDCMHHCANQRVKPVELTDIMVTACALLINVLLAPVVGQMISTQLFHDSIVGTVLAIFMPFLLAALILVLPCPTGIHIGYKIDSFDDDFSEEHDHLADDEHHP